MENLGVYDSMGFEKRYLPNLETLKQEYETLGHDEFIRRILKYEALIGPTDSINFTTEKTKKNKDDQCTTTSHE